MKAIKVGAGLGILFGLALVCGVAQVKSGKIVRTMEVQPLDLPLVAPDAVPENGTFWMASFLAKDTGAPYPWNPLSGLDVPVYWLRGSSFIVDDRVVGGVNHALMAMHLLELAANGLPLDAPVELLRSSGPPPPSITTNDLWLELNDDDFTNGFARLTLPTRSRAMALAATSF